MVFIFLIDNTHNMGEQIAEEKTQTSSYNNN